MLKTVVIEDEKDVREELIKRLSASGNWNVIGNGDSVSKAVDLIKTKLPDVIFLDIRIREGDAFEVIDLLRRDDTDIPPIILNTGHRDFEAAWTALDNYKEYILKPIVKPFWDEWEKKEKEIIELLTANFFFITKSDGLSHRVAVKDILYLKASDGGAFLHLKNKTKIFTYTPIVKLLDRVNNQNLIHIHRSTVVNKVYVIAKSTVLVRMSDGTTHDISRQKRNEVKKEFNHLPTI